MQRNRIGDQAQLFSKMQRELVGRHSQLRKHCGPGLGYTVMMYANRGNEAAIGLPITGKNEKQREAPPFCRAGPDRSKMIFGRPGYLLQGRSRALLAALPVFVRA